MEKIKRILYDQASQRDLQYSNIYARDARLIAELAHNGDFVVPRNVLNRGIGIRHPKMRSTDLVGVLTPLYA